jgi:prepilin-type processing-associated H-X9-DG protein
MQYGVVPDPPVPAANIFKCPSASLDIEGISPGQEPHLIGYGMSQFIPPADDAPAGRDRRNIYPKPPGIDEPEKIKLIADGRYWTLGSKNDLNFPTNPGRWYKLDRMRHNRGCVLLYADGHVKWGSEAELYQEYLAEQDDFWKK